MNENKKFTLLILAITSFVLVIIVDLISSRMTSKTMAEHGYTQKVIETKDGDHEVIWESPER